MNNSKRIKRIDFFIKLFVIAFIILEIISYLLPIINWGFGSEDDLKQTEATILELSSEEEGSYLVTYNDQFGNEHQGTIKSGAIYEEGERVTIYYDKNNPEKISLNYNSDGVSVFIVMPIIILYIASIMGPPFLFISFITLIVIRIIESNKTSNIYFSTSENKYKSSFDTKKYDIIIDAEIKDYEQTEDGRYKINIFYYHKKKRIDTFVVVDKDALDTINKKNKDIIKVNIKHDDYEHPVVNISHL